MKTCIKCGETKEDSEFVKRGDKRMGDCSVCRNAYNRAIWKEKNGTKLRDKQARREADPKRCKKCKEIKPLSEYNWLRKGSHRSKCKECQKKDSAEYFQTGGREVQKKYVEDNKERYQKHAVKFREKYEKDGRSTIHSRKCHLKKYGLTIACYEKMLEEQGGKCAICGTTEPGRRRKAFAVDHDHDTGKVRSLLCIGCNVGLGHYKDDPSLLIAAAKYLERHKP